MFVDDIAYLSKEELIDVILEYDRYIQDANDEDKFHDGWRPVGIAEFYLNEFKSIIEAVEKGYF